MSLQLRLWLTVVVIVVAGALVLVIGTSALYERVMLPFDTVSTQSLSAVNAAVIRHGAEAVDAASRASADAAVRAATVKGEMSPEAEAALLSRAGSQGAPTFALLAKPDGTLAGKAGDAKLEGPVTGLPVFVEATTGIARDDRFAVDGTAYHLAAAPIYDGALVGVVILGWGYDGTFADRLSQQVGAPVILIAGGKRMGSALPELTAEQLNVRGQGVGDLNIAPLPRFLPLLVPDRTRYTLMSLPVFSGESQLAIVAATDRNEALRALAYVQALVIAGTLLIALLQLILVWSTIRAVSKPIEIIVDHLSQVSQGNTVGILPEAMLTGQFLRLGKQLNMILQNLPSASRTGAGASSLGALGAPSLPPSVGDPELPATPMRAGQGQAPVGELSLGAGAVGAPAKPAPTVDPSSALSSLFDDGPGAADPLAAFRVPPKQPQPPHPPPPEPVQEADDVGAERLPPDSPHHAMSPEATVMFQVPQELLKQSAQASLTVPPPSKPAPPSAPMPMPMPMPLKNTDDARTVVAAVPQELLGAIAGRDGLTSADEAHYKEVYTKFVETRVQCGEDTSDLTYDRFVAKLMKNRQQIIEKHKAKSVRFQVYVKEGKAALRALPVRE